MVIFDSLSIAKNGSKIKGFGVFWCVQNKPKKLTMNDLKCTVFSDLGPTASEEV